MNSLAHLNRQELDQLRTDPRIGEVLREKIDEQLNGGVPKTDAQIRKTPARKLRRMTVPERTYADVLDMRIRRDEVVCYWFDLIPFAVGVGATFRPDFVALLPSGSIEVVEVKGGHIWEDARLKFKTAKLLYPQITWRMLQLKHGVWRELYAKKR